MCGIVGFTGLKNREVLLEMMDKIAHRGPDDVAVFEEEISLGMKRLSILDLRKNLYPLQNANKSLTLIYNGEIYNYRDLKKRLGKKSQDLKTKVDGEIILLLYKKYGTRCLRYLDGMFAFVLYDKEKQILFCARDRFGEKPFYYSVIAQEFIFGSEVKSLIVHPSVSKRINYQGLYYYLRFGFVPRENSIFNDINKLEPGHYLKWDLRGKNLEINKYWDLEVKSNVNGQLSFARYEAILEKLLSSSIKGRLNSDVPLGVFLSGGVDSSLVTALVKKISGKKVSTFSVQVSKGKFDESRKALKIAEHLGTKHYQVQFGSSDVIESLLEINQRSGEPICDPGAMPTVKLSREARKKVKVVLTGEGADELFAGYDWYKDNLKFVSKWRWLPKLVNSLDGQILPYRLIKYLSSLTTRYFPPQYYTRWKAARLMDTNQVEYVDPFVDLKKKDFQDTLQLMQYVDIKSYLADHLLTKVDRTTMFNGLEARTVFLEKNLSQFAYTLPSKYKITSNYQDKYILRKIAENYLPSQYCWQEKHGFNLPLAEWLRDDIYSFAKDAINSLSVLDLPLDSNYASNLLYQHKCGQDNSHSIWNLICLINWYKNV